MNKNYKTTYHRDSTVTVWDVYSQSWIRTCNPSDRLLSTISNADRLRILKHVANHKESLIAA